MKDKEKNGKTRLSPCSLGFGFGVANGLSLMLLAFASAAWGYGDSIVTSIATLLHGYSASFLGGLAGLGWGFVHGFVFGFVAGLFYNLCRCCCCFCKSACMPESNGTAKKTKK